MRGQDHVHLPEGNDELVYLENEAMKAALWSCLMQVRDACWFVAIALAEGLGDWRTSHKSGGARGIWRDMA